MFKIFFSFLLVTLSCCIANAQSEISITPAKPAAGDLITITYDPQAAGATLADTVSSVQLVFTYSNFYEMPSKIDLVKKGSKWTTSFVIPRYGVLATFYLQGGQQKDMPEKGHYAIMVYNKNKERVKKSYLYEGYSLSAQFGRSPELAKNQAVKYEEELKHYPDNYEAKLRLLAHQIAIAPEAEKESLREKARAVIAAKFYEDPGNMGYMNSTTMGYLIIGENSRLDSLREQVKKQFPESEAGYELRIDEIRSMNDSTKMAVALEGMVSKENASNKTYLRDAHDMLFHYYASKKQEAKALQHLQKLYGDVSPYKPKRLKSQAEVLYNNGLALDTAFSLAQRSLALADTFPISLIRYFPETGYLPSYVTRQAREKSVKQVSANLYSLMCLIRLKQGKKPEAESFIQKALSLSKDAETLYNAAQYYESTGAYAKAFDSYKAIAFENADDTTAFNKMKKTWLVWKKTESGLDTEVNKLKKHWQQEMTVQLKKEIINIDAPEFISNIVDLKGNPVPKSLLEGKIVVLDFWATWCVPCMHEMPYLQRAYEQYANDTSVVFMVINSGAKNELSDAQNWWGNKKYTFPVYYNTDRLIGEKLGFNLIPATYVIDQRNNIRFKTIGFEGPVIERKIPAAIELLKKE